MTISPIRVRPTHATPDTVSQVVALCKGCLRKYAEEYLDAAYGDVDAACVAWSLDPRWGQREAYARFERTYGRSLEASE